MEHTTNTASRGHRCNTADPQRSCCWAARIAEDKAREERYRLSHTPGTPEYADREAYEATRKTRYAESFVAKGCD